MSINEKKNLELNPGIKTINICFYIFFVIIKYNHFFLGRILIHLFFREVSYNCRVRYNFNRYSLPGQVEKHLYKNPFLSFFYFIIFIYSKHPRK